jgi:hypothetical protein
MARGQARSGGARNSGWDDRDGGNKNVDYQQGHR